MGLCSGPAGLFSGSQVHIPDNKCDVIQIFAEYDEITSICLIKYIILSKEDRSNIIPHLQKSLAECQVNFQKYVQVIAACG